MRFEILTIKLNDLEAAFQKLNNKKFVDDNNKLSFVKIRDFKDKYGEFRTEIEVSGMVQNCGDYELIAVLNKISDTENIVNVVPGKELPEKYRSTEFTCDHCNINRYRKQVIVVKSLTEEKYVQVGRQCVKDYFSREVEQVVRKFEYLFEAIRRAENGGGCNNPYIGTRYFLAVCSGILRKCPFYPSAHAFSTKQTAYELIVAPESKLSREFVKDSGYELSDKDFELVDKAMEWIRNHPEDSDFFYNLKTIISKEDIQYKFTGYAAALINMYNKAIEKDIKHEVQEKTEKKVSEWVGSPKERTEVTAKCTFTKVIEGYYGDKTIVKFITEDGNVLTWFASSVVEDFEEDNDYKIKFTVKKHDEFRDEKQTIITRVKEAV